MRYFTWKPELVSDILPVIVGNNVGQKSNLYSYRFISPPQMKASYSYDEQKQIQFINEVLNMGILWDMCNEWVVVFLKKTKVKIPESFLT